MTEGAANPTRRRRGKYTCPHCGSRWTHRCRIREYTCVHCEDCGTCGPRSDRDDLVAERLGR